MNTIIWMAITLMCYGHVNAKCTPVPSYYETQEACMAAKGNGVCLPIPAISGVQGVKP